MGRSEGGKVKVFPEGIAGSPARADERSILEQPGPAGGALELAVVAVMERNVCFSGKERRSIDSFGSGRNN